MPRTLRRSPSKPKSVGGGVQGRGGGRGGGIYTFSQAHTQVSSASGKYGGVSELASERRREGE
jgi:hypothetical protein